MANEEHVAIIYQGVPTWNDWRDRDPEPQPDLSGAVLREADLTWANLRGVLLRKADLVGADLAEADLSGADLRGANLRGAILRGADLSWAYLESADLRGADLGGADLSEANLTGADLMRADLSGANLSGADLSGTNLFGADLTGASFIEAGIADTKFGDVDLSQVRGLTTVKHKGPSTIGIDTIYRSHGEIPEVFLRGAGVPEAFISFINTLVEKRSQQVSCYICHTARDKRFCDRLYADLQAHGVRTWYFPQEIPHGKQFLQAVELNGRVFDKVILVCSRHSLTEGNVLRELERSLKREVLERKQILYPIQLDNFALQSWSHPRKLLVMERMTADFRGWNRSAAKYDQGLRRLLHALKTL